MLGAVVLYNTKVRSAVSVQTPFDAAETEHGAVSKLLWSQDGRYIGIRALRLTLTLSQPLVLPLQILSYFMNLNREVLSSNTS